MLEIVGVWIKRVERVTVISKPGDPDLVRLINSDWGLDWKDGGLHPSGNEPRRYSFVREIPIRDDGVEQTLAVELLTTQAQPSDVGQSQSAEA